MADIFISYSRKDVAVAQRLQEALSQRGKDVWIDLENIPPSAEWMARIEQAIDASGAVVVLLSDHSLRSTVCGQEVQHAVERRKRLVPIALGITQVELVPEALRRINWIHWTDAEGPDGIMLRVIEAIETDLEHVAVHTRVLVRAAEWEARGRNASYLLRGADLSEAERWLGRSGGKLPVPSRLHTDYVQASRVSQIRRQRMVTGASLAAVAISSGLAVYAWGQRGDAIAESQRAQEKSSAAESARVVADRQARLALGRQLAAQAAALPDQGPKMLPRAALLAIEALRRDDSSDCDRAARKILRLLPKPMGVFTLGKGDGTRHLAVSPDGAIGAGTTTTGNRLVTFDTRTGRLLDVVQSAGATLPPVFAPGGRYLAGRGSSCTIWDLQARRAVAPLEAGVVDVAFSTDGTRALLTLANGSVAVYTIEPWQERSRRALPDVPELVTESPDGTVLFAALGEDRRKGRDATLMSWEAATGTLVRSTACPGVGSWLALSPGGELAVEAPYTGPGRVWKLSTGTAIDAIPALEQECETKATFSADGLSLALADDTHVVRVYSSRRQEPAFPGRMREVIGNIALSADGRTVAACGYDDTARVWDVGTGREIYRETHGDYVLGLALSADGRTVLSSQLVMGAGCVVLASRTDDWAEGPSLRHGDLYQPVVSWSEAGDRLYVRSEKGGGAWDAATGAAIPNPGPIPPAPAKLPDTRKSQDDPRIAAWLAAAGTTVKDSEINAQANRIVVSADGRYLSDMTQHFWIRILDSQAGGKVILKIRHESLLPDVTAFSPDGQLVATTANDALRNTTSVQIHDLKSGRERMNVDVPWGNWSAAFSPDSRRLAVASTDGVTRIYLARRDDLIAELGRRLRRNLTRQEWEYYLPPGEPYAPTVAGLPTPVEDDIFIGGYESQPSAFAEPAEKTGAEKSPGAGPGPGT